MTELNKIADAIKAGETLLKPVYQDGLQPAVKKLGGGLETVAELVLVTLAPIRALVWGAGECEEFLKKTVAAKLDGASKEKIQTPDPTIAGPVIEALRFTGCKDELKDLYANLLANAIYVDTANNAHPAFVDIIKNLTTDEAKIMTLFSKTNSRDVAIIQTRAHLKKEQNRTGYIILRDIFSLLGEDAGCTNPKYISSYIQNLIRLGLAEIPNGKIIVSPQGEYDRLISHYEILIEREQTNSSPEYEKYEIDKQILHVTDFGKQFISACVTPPKIK